MSSWVRTLLITGSPDEVAAARAGHLEQLRGLAARGRLRAAGELGEGDGFVEIFEADDRREAEAIARASPLVEGGLGSYILRQWTELRL